MARTRTTEGQALRQPGGAEEDGRFHEGHRHLRLAYKEEEEEETALYISISYNNNNECISRAPFHMKHAQLR